MIVSLKKILVVLGLMILTAGCGSTGSSRVVTQTQNVISPNANTLPTGEASLTKSWAHAPIAFYISNNIPDRLVQPILDSFSDWEESAGQSLFNYQGRIDSATPTADGRNVVYWNPERNPDGLLGVTTTRIHNNHEIIEGDITFFGNPDLYDALHCEGSVSNCRVRVGKFDVTTLALHEIGHLLGFEHAHEEGGVMNPDFGMNDVVHNLDNEMIAQVQEAYPAQVAQR